MRGERSAPGSAREQMRFSTGGRGLERLAGSSSDSAPRGRWRTHRTGADPWSDREIGDIPWLRRRVPSLAREALQGALLFPATRLVARPRILGADDLVHAPQPAVIAPNHASDIDTPLILSALPRSWRVRTVVGAASDRFYRRRRYALMAGLWINTFPFDRRGEGRGLAEAARLLREGHNVLLYPQATRASGTMEGFRAGVARLCAATGVPLVPVYAGGTATIMPKGRGLSRRGAATVAFGAPLWAGPDEDPHAFAARAQETIAALARGSRTR